MWVLLCVCRAKGRYTLCIATAESQSVDHMCNVLGKLHISGAVNEW